MSGQASQNAKTSIHKDKFRQLSLRYDSQHRVVWCYMHAAPRSCFTPQLLSELERMCDLLAAELDHPKRKMVDYVVMASAVPGVFNLGGDLALFRELVINRNRSGLRQYAHACIELQWNNLSHLDNRDVTTVALVQGEALGGGFEAAMFANVMVAERGARMGLPEILFNLFPGMGAFSILSRKLDPARAERMILSGKIFTAEELHELGVVDVLAEDGKGEEAVYEYIARENRSRNGIRALRAAKAIANPITREELRSVADVWVDAALRLKSRDLRLMERLVARQSAMQQRAA
jgi:DSF synthase